MKILGSSNSAAEGEGSEATLPASKPKKFFTRQAYIDLESEGLTALPPVPGCFLSCHESSCQWHAGYPNAQGGISNRAPMWADHLRSERKALITALHFLWSCYFKRSGHGEDQVAKLSLALEKE